MQKKVFIHTLINSESSSRCLEDILISRAGRDMELSYFSPLSQLHTTKDLDSALIQQPPKLQQILKFVLVSRHLFFYSAGTLPNAAGGGKKKEVGRKWHFWFPQYEHGTVPTPAHSIHQWTHDFCWHPISTDCPASDMGSITPRCHNLIVFIDLCTKF